MFSDLSIDTWVQYKSRAFCAHVSTPPVTGKSRHHTHAQSCSGQLACSSCVYSRKNRTVHGSWVLSSESRHTPISIGGFPCWDFLTAGRCGGICVSTLKGTSFDPRAVLSPSGRGRSQTAAAAAPVQVRLVSPPGLTLTDDYDNLTRYSSLTWQFARPFLTD